MPDTTNYNVRLNLDNKPYSSKDDAKREIAIIRNRMAPITIDVRKLPEGVVKGYSFCHAELSGTLAKDWVSQRLFCVDVDNEHGSCITPDDAAELMSAVGVTPLFMYYSFSHTPEHPKFRVVVLTTETITDPEQAARMREGLYSLFPPDDKCSLDANRIYFGTNKGLCEGFEFTGEMVEPGVLERLYYERCEPDHFEAQKLEGDIGEDSELGRAIEEFDLVEYIERTTGITPEQVSGQWRFNPCPICGHRDHFDVIDNVFNEKSPNGGYASGNIINYLEAVNGFTREQARDYFMYDILGWDREERLKQFKESKRMERVERVTHEPATEEVPEYVIEKRDKNGEVTSRYISAPVLAQHIREREKYLFTRGGAMSGVNRFWYSGGYYRHVSDDEIKGIIKGYVERYDYTMLKMKDINEAFQQLVTDRVFYDDSQLNADENLVNFSNGILNLTTWELLPHSPKYLMTRQIPVEWKPEGGGADVFHRYMAYLCDGKDSLEDMSDTGRAKYKILMEFLGACVSNVHGYRFKKSLFMYGAGDTGKSQLKSLAEYMIGQENCCPCDLGQLEARFGTSAIFNKRLIGSSDMPFLTIDELDVFKQVTGGDALFAEYKGKNGFPLVLDGLSWFCMNRLPRFGGDNGQWVYDRIIPVECSYVVPEDKRDKELLDKMKLEASAIIYEALHYFKDAVDSGYRFSETEDTKLQRNNYRKENDSILSWVSEQCITRENADEFAGEFAKLEKSKEVPTASVMYRAYRDWCKTYENGYCLKQKDFKNSMESIFGKLEKRACGMVYRGVYLKPQVAGMYSLRLV